MSDYTPCGGCGAEDPSKRCINCFHNFGGDSVAQSVGDSPTPETDAARITEKNGCIATVCGQEVVSANFARRLERERDEARREASSLKEKEMGAVVIMSAEHRDYLEGIESERDSLRARVAELELNLSRATMTVERAMTKTSLGWTIPGFVEQFKRLLAKKA